MFSEIIILLKKVDDIDEYGDVKRKYTEREVFIRKDRIFLNESLQAMSQGFQKQLRCTLSDYYDYENEKELIYKDEKYRVINTQEKGTELELNCVSGLIENDET